MTITDKFWRWLYELKDVLVFKNLPYFVRPGSKLFH